MPSESQHLDKKSLQALSNHGVRDLARDVVAFANAAGGHLLIGIEDDVDSPPKPQKISDKQVEELRKRIGELTINVLYTVKKCSDENGVEYIDLSIAKTMKAPTSTTDGQYLIRVGDHSPHAARRVIAFHDR